MSQSISNLKEGQVSLTKQPISNNSEYNDIIFHIKYLEDGASLSFDTPVME